jgi:pheromone shutdown protein TraB
MKLRIPAFLWLWACLHSGAFAAELPDYIRYAENRQSARLEVAIKSFTLTTGQQVDLIGVVHIADHSYYQELNQRFTAYDSVLFELVGDPSGLQEMAPLTEEQRKTQTAGGGISTMQLSAAKYLNLTFQLGAIDYRGKNMVHADTSAEEFAQMQQARGESMLTLFARAMQVQMNGEINRTSMNELNTFALIRILLSPDSAAEFKKSLAKMFDQMESVTAVLEGKDGSVILSGRNEVAVKKLKEVLASKKQRRVAVFYGAAHLPGIEATLTADLKAKPSGEEWLSAWTMPKAAQAPPAKTGAATQSDRGASTSVVPAGQ